MTVLYFQCPPMVEFSQVLVTQCSYHGKSLIPYMQHFSTHFIAHASNLQPKRRKNTKPLYHCA